MSFSHPICRWAEDGSLVDDGGSYTNWREGEGQPNGDGDCMYMYYIDGTWYDTSCDFNEYAVCSKPIASAAATGHNIPNA